MLELLRSDPVMMRARWSNVGKQEADPSQGVGFAGLGCVFPNTRVYERGDAIGVRRAVGLDGRVYGGAASSNA